MVESVAVNKTPDRNESVAAKAARELAQLQQQAEQARVLLTRMQPDILDRLETAMGAINIDRGRTREWAF